ncbi:peptidoglycan editing factor PgeF [Luteimonas rhizosphaerae]|uniref:peptidoglycan editing factor PgeF n=1 Tax=Luteimonas sp. 4-12 TaxID=2027406 RepID=UPI000C7E0A10|nr:peptidoglycan editing factor PgeF [Luteimonas sp. 4-12]
MSALLHADWPAPPGVHALTTLRHGAGVSPPPFDRFNFGNTGPDGDAPANVVANRAALVEIAALPAPAHWLRQVHGTGVQRFAAPARPDAVPVEADASVTSVPGVVLAILTADCLPVVFAARDGSEIAAAHAGWRGLAAGVLERTVAGMTASSDALIAWFGPAAGAQAYEIGREVFDACTADDPDAVAAFAPTRPGHWRVDLYALARRRLAAAGMDPTAIHGGERCTIREPEAFFSHRRDARTGRLATLAWIER